MEETISRHLKRPRSASRSERNSGSEDVPPPLKKRQTDVGGEKFVLFYSKSAKRLDPKLYPDIAHLLPDNAMKDLSNFSLILLATLFCFFFGRLAPKDPRLILPFLDFMSPFPIVFQI